MGDIKKLEISIYGLVQGVGFRPFVAELADRLGISGTVCNSGGVVSVVAIGDEGSIEDFLRGLIADAPVGSRVDDVSVDSVCVIDDVSTVEGASHCDCFSIVESISREDDIRFLPADIATCERCESELVDPDNRRYRYPFISCVSCGPRYTIMKKLPYDRVRTSMDRFSLCEKCRSDYTEVGNIRRHAQTIACEDCGPQVSLIDKDAQKIAGDEAIDNAVHLIKSGKIVAIKGIGGYHLCFDATCEEAAKKLRQYKSRENKPFAVMFRDTDEISRYAHMSDTESELLTSHVRPIVLLDREPASYENLAPSVCAHSLKIGAMLPCNPIQILILRECSPVVMTSANRGGEPIITDDEKMIDELASGYIDAVLSYDREIISGLDDSIYQVINCNSSVQIQIIRRARGLVPEPIRIGTELSSDVFAAGGDLKAVFAFGRKNMVYLSGHFGDLEDADSARTRAKAMAHMADLLGFRGDRIKTTVTDLHPRYHSVISIDDDMAQMSDDGNSRMKYRSLRVQHHHAHIASVMAEHGLKDRILGLAFDGTGYGTDGHIWGSEFLICEGDEFTRGGYFSEIKTIGGDVSTDANTTLYAYMYQAEREGLISSHEVDVIYDRTDDITILRAALDNNINTTYTTSMGRLFDAVSALLHICDNNSYEGECPQRLQGEAEKLCISSEDSSQPMRIYEEYKSMLYDVLKIDNIYELIIDKDNTYIADSVKLVAGIAKLYIRQKTDSDIQGKLSILFHGMISELATVVADRIATRERIKIIALSGGTMCNRLLVTDMEYRLREKGYEVYMNNQVPCGDGGLALGQAYISAVSE